MQEDYVTIILEEEPQQSPWLALFANKQQQPQGIGKTKKRSPDQLDLCPFAVNSKCKFTADTCKFIHGTQCTHCEKFCLHPFRQEEANAHSLECQRIHKYSNSAKEKDIECAICYEKIISTNEARFGLLNCEHSFCLNCIKFWRKQKEQQTLGRSCPICRILTHFVTPSCSWPVSNWQKNKIIERYKQKLSSIDCKHFQFGKAECPFGSSCFYAHRNRKGQIAIESEIFSRRIICPNGSIRALPLAKMSEFLKR
jgi:E3 ubiquitin-protein ligase makorin